MDQQEPCIIFITTSNNQEARTIAEALVREKLAACCSCIPAVRSWYMWRDALETADESLLICKSFMADFERLEARVRALHSYEVPEIVAVPMTQASAPYLAWMKAGTGISGS